MTGHLTAVASALCVPRDARPGCRPVSLLRMRKVFGGAKNDPHAEERRQARLEPRRTVIQRLFSAFFQPTLAHCDRPYPEGTASPHPTTYSTFPAAWLWYPASPGASATAWAA